MIPDPKEHNYHIANVLQRHGSRRYTEDDSTAAEEVPYQEDTNEENLLQEFDNETHNDDDSTELYYDALEESEQLDADTLWNYKQDYEDDVEEEEEEELEHDNAEEDTPLAAQDDKDSQDLDNQRVYEDEDDALPLLSQTLTYLIQLRHKSSIEKFKKQYPKIHVGAYIPHSSWIISASHQQIEELLADERELEENEHHPFLTFISPLNDDHKSAHHDDIHVVLKEHSEDGFLSLNVHTPHYKTTNQLRRMVRKYIVGGVLKKVLKTGRLNGKNSPESSTANPPVWKVRTISPRRFIVVVTKPDYILSIMKLLKQSPLVHWIEVKPYQTSTLLKDATGLVQNFDKPKESPLWKRGLTGKGQLIGVGDTGMDVNHCMFYDPAHQVPFFSWTGSNSPPASNHRKIKSYWTYMDGVDSEGLYGHGTHVSGIAAGSPLQKITPKEMMPFKSLAYDSKMVFMDIGCDSGGHCKCPKNFQCECDLRPDGQCKQRAGVVFLPIDLNHSYFPYFYAQGARISSNSWGTGYFKDFSYGYSTNTQEIDEFVWKHKDFLPFFAAGNSGGAFSYISLTSEAEAKNAVSVGASQNTPTSDAHIFQHDYNVIVDSFRKVLIKRFCGVGNGFNRKKCLEAKKFMDSESCCRSDLLHEDQNKCGNQAFSFQIGFKCCPRCIKHAAESGDSRNYGANNLGEFSARGPTSDGRAKPDIVTVGAPLMSAVSKGTKSSRRHCSKSLEFGSEIASRMGTSMACPLAASEGIVIRQFFTDGYYPSGSPQPKDAFIPSAALMKATLIHSTRVMTGYVHLPSRNTYWPLLFRKGHRMKLQQDAFQGFGMVDLVRVLGSEQGKNTRGLYIPNKKDAELSTGQVHEYCVLVKRSQMTKSFDKLSHEELISSVPGFRATLVWTDYPSSPAAQQHLVNDLDLLVLDSTGKMHFGNGDKSHVQTTSHGPDRKNNVEDVVFTQKDLAQVAAKSDRSKQSDPLSFNVVVRGAYVPHGPQPYALVMTGVEESAVSVVEGKCAPFHDYKLLNHQLVEKLTKDRDTLKEEFDLLENDCSQKENCSGQTKRVLLLAKRAIMSVQEDIHSAEGTL